VATIFANTGMAIAAKRMFGATQDAAPAQAEPSRSAVGSAAGTAAVGDTTLFTEFTTGTWTGYARVNGTTSTVTTTNTNDTYQCVATHTAPGTGGPYGVTNAGLFDAATTGNLFVKGDFSVVNLAAGDSLQLTYKLKFS
jgi:hypothetical protein